MVGGTLALEKVVLEVECWVGHQVTLDKEPGLSEPWLSHQDNRAHPGGLSSGLKAWGWQVASAQPQLLLMRLRTVT